MKNTLSYLALCMFVASPVLAGDTPRKAVGTTPLRMGADVTSTDAIEYNTSFLPDGRTLYFTRSTDDWSVLTVMASSIGHGRFVAPEPVLVDGEPINGGDPHMSPDGKHLFHQQPRFGHTKQVLWLLEYLCDQICSK